MIEHVKNLNTREVFLAIVGFDAVLAPGFLTIYHYHPELVQQLDFMKLLIFSLALAGPVLLLQAFATAMAVAHIKPLPADGSDLLFYGAIGTSVAMFPSLLVAYLFHLPFKWFVGLVALLSVLLIAAFKRVITLSNHPL